MEMCAATATTCMKLSQYGGSSILQLYSPGWFQTLIWTIFQINKVRPLALGECNASYDGTPSGHQLCMAISLEPRFPRCHVQYCERAPEVQNTNLDNCLPAYDGRRSMYTNGELSFNTKEFEVTLPDNKPGPSGQRREAKFKVTIKHAADAHGRDLHGHTGAGARHCVVRHHAQQTEQHGGLSW